MTQSLREVLTKTLDAIETAGPYPSSADQADAALSTLELWLAENGLKIVPVEATGEMAEAGRTRKVPRLKSSKTDVLYRDIYEAMIAAAPDPLKEPKGEG